LKERGSENNWCDSENISSHFGRGGARGGEVLEIATSAVKNAPKDTRNRLGRALNLSSIAKQALSPKSEKYKKLSRLV